MSRSVEREIICPRCHTPQLFTFWESVNATESPELKERLESGELFDFTCPACGGVSRIGYPLLYHDQAHRAMLFLADDREREQAYGVLEALLTLPESAGMMSGYIVRAVTQPMDLAEKILLLDRGLDDRVVELTKLMIRAGYLQEHPQADIRHMLLVEAEGLRYLTFVEGVDAPLSTPFNREVYDEIQAHYGAFFPKEKRDSLFVDLGWAAALLTPSSTVQ